MERLKKSGKRLLITIDEMTNSEYMKVFAGAFQIFVRQELPVFLLGTGLYENIEELQNEKSLTFLYRAPKIQLKPLNNAAIINKYKTIFNISPEKAAQMAGLTKGYPFAFQVLGYLTWNNDGDYNGILGEYEQYLSENLVGAFSEGSHGCKGDCRYKKRKNKRNQGCNWDGDKRIQSVP